MLADNAVPLSAFATHKKFLLLFFVCCSLPFVAAKLALEFSWFPAGVTNKGQWLEREIQLLPVSTHTQQHWHLVYVQAQECAASCELALYTMQQIKNGFGRQQNKISVMILADKMPQQLAEFSGIQWQLSHQQLTGFQDHIFIVNQQGLALLRYASVYNKEQMLIIGKDIRTDLRRLMVYDRDSL